MTKNLPGELHDPQDFDALVRGGVLQLDEKTFVDLDDNDCCCGGCPDGGPECKGCEICDPDRDPLPMAECV